MMGRGMLCLMVPILLAACDGAVTDGQTSGTGGGAGNGGNGGSSTCATGDRRAALGDKGDSATLGIVSDTSGVYWVKDDATVWHAAPGGGAAAILAENVGKLPYTLASDADALYVVDYAAALYRVDKMSGATVMLAQGAFVAVAVDDKSIYLTEAEGVYRVDKKAGNPQLWAPLAGADSVVVDNDFVYARSAGTTVDSTSRVVRVPKLGGNPVEIAAPSPLEYHYFAQELAVDAKNVYWVHASNGTISKAPKDGGPEEVLVAGLADPESIAIDADFVYFTVRGKDGGSKEDRAVAKVSKNGGAVIFIAHGAQVSAFAIAVDDTNAYWTQHVIGGVVETACK